MGRTYIAGDGVLMRIPDKKSSRRSSDAKHDVHNQPRRRRHHAQRESSDRKATRREQSGPEVLNSLPFNTPAGVVVDQKAKTFYQERALTFFEKLQMETKHRAS